MIEVQLNFNFVLNNNKDNEKEKVISLREQVGRAGNMAKQ